MIGPILMVVLALLGPESRPDIDITGIEITDIDIAGAWAPPPLAAGRPMAVYMRLANHGPGADRLIGVHTDAPARASLHLSSMRDGIARMRAVEALDLAPGQSVELAPGGYHIMVMKPPPGLKPGATLPLTLEFEKAGPRQVMVAITTRP